jgi:SAM-dependent methyltransferase
MRMRRTEIRLHANRLNRIWKISNAIFPELNSDETAKLNGVIVNEVIVKKLFFKPEADESLVRAYIEKKLLHPSVRSYFEGMSARKIRGVYHDRSCFWIGNKSDTHNLRLIKKAEIPVARHFNNEDDIPKSDASADVTETLPADEETSADADSKEKKKKKFEEERKRKLKEDIKAKKEALVKRRAELAEKKKKKEAADKEAAEAATKAKLLELDPLDTDELENGEIFYYPPYAPEILDCIKHGEHTYIVGPAGCGKSTMARLLAKRSGLEPIYVDFSAGIDEATFLGSKTVELDEKTGERIIKFEYGIFPQAVKEGRPLILNEIDFAKSKYLASLHGILEENHPHLVLMENAGEVLYPAEGFVIIATANTLGHGDDLAEYHGTEALNAAFLDRFDSFFQVGYTTEEKTIIFKITNDRILARSLVAMTKDIRNLKDADQVSTTLTTRRLKMISKKAVRIGIKKALINVMITRCDPDDKEQLLEIAQRHFPKDF